MAKQIIVLGAGASGLAAAIAASRAGACVTVLEHGRKSAQKILATGNGKCNLGNRHVDGSFYHCPDPIFVETVLGQWSSSDTETFFRELGIQIRERAGGLYPYSEQASAVRDVLLMEAAHRGVKIKNNCSVEKIERQKDGWLLHTPGWEYKCEALILATGSFASNIPGADGSGYALAESLGHSVRKPLPALVPLMCTGVPTKRWAGIRMEGSVTLYLDGRESGCARGELQMTDYGISGIPVFQISGTAVRGLEEGRRAELLLDLLPGFSPEELVLLMEERQRQCPYKAERELYVGLLPDKLIGMLPRENPLQWLKALPLRVTGSRPARYAQVVSGGVNVCDINPRTMQSRLQEDLYFAGEIMDVDGICGGYNLHWAWATGNIAGYAAAGELSAKNGPSVKSKGARI